MSAWRNKTQVVDMSGAPRGMAKSGNAPSQCGAERGNPDVQTEIVCRAQPF